MKEVHLTLWDLAHREIIDLLDEARHEADWICLGENAAIDRGGEDRVWLLTADQLSECGCTNCDRHERLRFWVDSRRKAEVELEKLGCFDRGRSKSWTFGPKA